MVWFIVDVVVYIVLFYLIIKIGVFNFIYFVLVGYVMRLVCYVFIINIWCFFFFEVLLGLIFVGGWVGFVVFIVYNFVEGVFVIL